MKLVIALALTSLFSLPALAYDVAPKALQTLLNENPEAVRASGGGVIHVNSLLAQALTSQFDKDGKGTLAVTHNECRPGNRALIYECTLTVLKSQRVRDAHGAYVPAPEAEDETGLTIEYDVDVKAEHVLGFVIYSNWEMKDIL